MHSHPTWTDQVGQVTYGHQITFGHFSGNDITILNTLQEFKVKEVTRTGVVSLPLERQLERKKHPLEG